MRTKKAVANIFAAGAARPGNLINRAIHVIRVQITQFREKKRGSARLASGVQIGEERVRRLYGRLEDLEFFGRASARIAANSLSFLVGLNCLQAPRLMTVAIAGCKA